MTTETPTQIYYGVRETILAEVGEHCGIYAGKYLVAPVGEQDWDCIGVNTLKEMRAVVAELRAAYPAAQMIRA